MSYFDTLMEQNTMENISCQLTQIADSLETLAAACGKTFDMAPCTKAEEVFRQLEDRV